jgi:phosphoribosylanthranilate isomerase
MTRVEDALLAAQLGADAIGLIFYPPSARYIEPPQAATLVRQLPPFVSVVGLFLNAEPAWVREVMDQVPLDLLQFHGTETPDYCIAFGRPYLKALAMGAELDLAAQMAAHAQARGFLADSHRPGEAGGLGMRFDWSHLLVPSPRPLILAGGLTPDNVEAAIEQVRPWGVDVASGVECAKGIKDSHKMSEFIKGVYRAGSQ